MLLSICAVIARYNNAVASVICTLCAVDLVLACLLETIGDGTKLVLSLKPSSLTLCSHVCKMDSNAKQRICHTSANDRLQCLAEVSYDNGMEFMESIRKWPANLKPEGRSVDGLWLQDYLPDTLLHSVSTHTE